MSAARNSGRARTAHGYGFLLAQLKGLGVPMPEQEYRFVDDRRWRFDFAWPVQRVALEIEGGIWIRGRHTRPIGFLRDMEKYNRAAVEGWRILRATPQDVASTVAATLVWAALGGDAERNGE